MLSLYSGIQLMITQNVTLSDVQESKYKKWKKILVLD